MEDQIIRDHGHALLQSESRLYQRSLEYQLPNYLQNGQSRDEVGNVLRERDEHADSRKVQCRGFRETEAQKNMCKHSTANLVSPLSAFPFAPGPAVPEPQRNQRYP